MSKWLMEVVQDVILSDADKARHMLDIVEGKIKTSWLKKFDPNAHNGRGAIWMTKDRAEAKRFDSFAAVMECWKTQSTLVPVRPDGKPNRPLTAFTIQPVEAPDE
jgi:hypothetical protein